MGAFRGIATAVLVALVASAAAERPPPSQSTCPPPGFSSVESFSLRDYIARPWFPQQQAINSYQREDQLFCVRAEYRLANGGSSRLLVFNQARQGSVTGPIQNNGSSAFRLLNAVVRNRDRGQLAVGPSFIPDFLYGPYWVVAAGPSAPGQSEFTGYEWAIVSGGPPRERGSIPGTCTNPAVTNFWRRLFNPFGSGEGLWLFTREPVASEETVAQLRSIAQEKGFDVSVLKPVARRLHGGGRRVQCTTL